MNKIAVLDNFNLILDKLAWTRVLSEQKDEAIVSEPTNF